MSHQQRRMLRSLEGRPVSLALADGSRIDGAVLVSGGTRTAWIFSNGADRFVPLAEVIDVWEAPAAA
jgi:hypothetical protein